MEILEENKIKLIKNYSDESSSLSKIEICKVLQESSELSSTYSLLFDLKGETKEYYNLNMINQGKKFFIFKISPPRLYNIQINFSNIANGIRF
jgi:hypothetical protein